MSPSRPPKPLAFSIGDRVVHRTIFFKDGQTHQRKGQVTDIIYKHDKAGAKFPYYKVKWDTSSREETYLGMRLKAQEQTDVA